MDKVDAGVVLAPEVEGDGERIRRCVVRCMVRIWWDGTLRLLMIQRATM